MKTALALGGIFGLMLGAFAWLFILCLPTGNAQTPVPSGSWSSYEPTPHAYESASPTHLK